MPPLWEVRVRTPINVARKPLSCPPAQPSSALLHPMASPAYDPSAMYMKPVCMRKERARTPSLCLYRSKALVKPILRSTSARSPANNPIRVRMHTRKENSASLHHTLSNTHIVRSLSPNSRTPRHRDEQGKPVRQKYELTHDQIAEEAGELGVSGVGGDFTILFEPNSRRTEGV